MTLVNAGYVTRRRQDGRYYLAVKLRRLGLCVRDDDIYAQLAGPALSRLVKKIYWPSDFAMLSAGRLTIVDSNYPLSSLTLFPSVLGQTRPMMRSALGRAMLAGMLPAQLSLTIDTLRCVGGEDALDLANTAHLTALIEETQKRGYAVAAGEAVDRIGAIALPVRVGEIVVGATNVVMFISAFDADRAAAAFLEPLGVCVTEIEAALLAATYKSSGHEMELPLSAGGI
jgi:IclR family mhp operon transcriptional activator